MWNINLKPGAIWTIKNIFGNQNTKSYEHVLILSIFKDTKVELSKFTYLKITTDKNEINKNEIYLEINIRNEIFYLLVERLYTSSIDPLFYYVRTLSTEQLNNVIIFIKYHFNLHTIKSSKTKEEKQQYKLAQEYKEITQQRIHKFGIDILVTENENVTLDKNKKLILSAKAKKDIIYNSKTDEDIRILCDKYQIYPLKAIKEIRNRLVYQHKQKEG